VQDEVIPRPLVFSLFSQLCKSRPESSHKSSVQPVIVPELREKLSHEGVDKKSPISELMLGDANPLGVRISDPS
jgi:hypothetical protein